MALSGPAMMLKSFGIDPEKIMGDFVALKVGVEKILAEIDAKLSRVEVSQRVIQEHQHGASAMLQELHKLQVTNEKLLMELTQWKRVNNPTVILNPPLSAPQPPQLPQPQQNQPPQPQ